MTLQRHKGLKKLKYSKMATQQRKPRVNKNSETVATQVPPPATASTSAPVVASGAVRKGKPKQAVVKTEPTQPVQPVVQPVAPAVQPEVKAEPLPSVETADVAVKRTGRQKVYVELNNSINALVSALANDIEAGKFGANDKLIKKYQKEAIKVQTKVQKLQKKPKTETSDKPLHSGFSKPLQIAPEMAQFAGWKAGEFKSRNEVNKALCNYVKDRGLQDSSDRRRITPDDKLAKLLHYNKDQHEVLTFATMQKHLSHLFV